MSHILVIDDNLEILLVVRAALEEAGHLVVTTSTPQEALALVASEPVEVVISDIMMPEISGTELLGLLRRIPGREQLPILFLSALSDTDSRIKGLRLGADDYLGKPFDPAELVARVERLLTRHRPLATGLSGDLTSFSLSTLIQSLAEQRSNGVLEVSGGPVAGSIVLRSGQMAEARCRELLGVDAALALLAAPRGRFQFTASGSQGPAGTPSPAVAWQAILLEAAWTEDELSRRRQMLPAASAPLHIRRAATPEIPTEFHHIPIGEVLHALASREALTLAELLDRDLAAPARVELAVSWLFEQGWLEA